MEKQMASNGQSIISLKKLSLMTGFSEELIIDELLLNHTVDEKGRVDLETLRRAMISYLNRTVINEGPNLTNKVR